jgi:hypothetical protein
MWQETASLLSNLSPLKAIQEYYERYSNTTAIRKHYATVHSCLRVGATTRQASREDGWPFIFWVRSTGSCMLQMRQSKCRRRRPAANPDESSCSAPPRAALARSCTNQQLARLLAWHAARDLTFIAAVFVSAIIRIYRRGCAWTASGCFMLLPKPLLLTYGFLQAASRGNSCSSSHMVLLALKQL